jgi:hypothetical protein
MAFFGRKRSLFASTPRSDEPEEPPSPPPERPEAVTYPLRAAFIVVTLGIIGYASVWKLLVAWPALNALEQGHKDAGTLEVEYCPNLVVFSGGRRFNEIFQNTRWRSYEFNAVGFSDADAVDIVSSHRVLFDETRLLNVLGRVGVRFLSLGFTRLHSLFLNIKLVPPVNVLEGSPAATAETWSDTGKQWTLVATGNPLGDHQLCDPPTMLQVARFLLAVSARDGFFTFARRSSILVTPPGFADIEAGPNSIAFGTADLLCFIALMFALALVITIFITSLLDESVIRAYKRVAIELQPKGAMGTSPVYDVAGPLFVANMMIQGPFTDSVVADAAFGALRMLIVIMLPAAVLYPLVAFAPTATAAWMVALTFETYLLLAGVHATLYLLGVAWNLRAWIGYAFYGMFIALSELTLFVAASWFLWMCVFVAYDPVGVLTVMIVVVSTGVYLGVGLRNALHVARMEAVPIWAKRASDDVTRQELLTYVVYFTLLTSAAVGVIFTGWIFATPASARTDNLFASFVTSSVIPFAEFLAARNVSITLAQVELEAEVKEEEAAEQ